ncbi:hypothetical protein D3C75_1163900 [compost metagenome]
MIATLHLAAVQPSVPLVEYLYVQPEGWLYDVPGLMHNGEMAIPQGAGLGLELNMDVFERFNRT